MDDDIAGDDPEHRATNRQRVFLSGRIVHSPHELTIGCAIQDLSETGARIRLTAPEPLMDPIFLIDVRHALAFRVKVAWRDGLRAGLSFIQRYDLKQPDQTRPLVLQRLWKLGA